MTLQAEARSAYLVLGDKLNIQQKLAYNPDRLQAIRRLLVLLDVADHERHLPALLERDQVVHQVRIAILNECEVSQVHP